ncbi:MULTISPECIES: Flp family type IVb pilin [Vibrio]|uniref:Flp family type IVb pilin n=1 Tax=Vibrio coralliilyticus TaxID=190893 RepID=A0AAP6ZN04_9VIBR|nr:MULTISPECIES: Flp family type IVb pilin [Vibrio]EEX34240.1 flp pilus assembly protein pilin Flp [Vibrio coralliilyticus ATCC BAA-450]MDE3898647.1 Flp family type IVb pilin [Vibrio sp. CC007]NOJ24267.1 Flp family type IVb pilin [Vibrio coralliilyticus]
MLKNFYIQFCHIMSKFHSDERGVTAVEYAIIAVAISAIVLAMFNGELNDALQTAMDTIADNINAANTVP